MDGEESEPPAVFDLASDSTRLDVLRALASAHSEAPFDPWLSYTELQSAAGVRDNGNFNYHLDRLGDLVVTGEPGYRLSRVGMEAVSAVASGVLDTDWSWGPVDAPGACHACGEPLELYYEDGVLRLTCGTEAHDVPLSVPPALLESYDGEALIERIALLENRWSVLTRRGVCAECGGHVEGEIEFGGRPPEHHYYHGRCERCGFNHGLPVGMYLLGHPAVERFYYDRGVDVRSRPFWTLEFCRRGAETVVSTEPLRLRVDVEHEGETLSLVVDRDGRVTDTERPGAE
jgi:hypothetical protein